MQTAGPLESTKIETTLEIDSFDKPKELVDVAAWSQLILNLLFLRPGTYPSLPEMGIGIDRFQYDFVDDAIAELSATISAQQQKYLPDVPLEQVNVSKVEQNGIPILVIQLYFTDRDGQTVSSAIALNAEKRNFLNFEVSW